MSLLLQYFMIVFIREVSCPYIWSSAYYRGKDCMNLFFWALFHWLSKERVVLIMFMVVGNNNNGDDVKFI